jgi:hypothetical protein
MKTKKGKKGLRSRARSIGKRMATGIKGTAIAAGTGAVASYGLAFARDKVGFLNKSWWAQPAVLIGSGHLLKQKPKLAPVGIGLVAIGGFLGAESYRNKALWEAAQAAQQSQPQQLTAASAEAGMLQESTQIDDDTGAVINAQERFGSAATIGRPRRR